MIRWLRSLFQKKMFAEILIGETNESPIDRRAVPPSNSTSGGSGLQSIIHVNIHCSDRVLPFIYSKLNRYMYLTNSSMFTWNPRESNGTVVWRIKATDDFVSFISGCLQRQGVAVSHGTFDVDYSVNDTPHLMMKPDGSIYPIGKDVKFRTPARELQAVLS